MSLKGRAQETLNIIETGGFAASDGTWVDLLAELRTAIDGTRLYTPAQLTEMLAEPRAGQGIARIEVTAETTQIAAGRLVEQEGLRDLVLLNFASARNAGGGFLNGAKAQEEDLARCSGLYPCLLTQPEYYAANRSQSSLLYTDHMIYSPNVPWFRCRSRDRPEQVFLASVITAPAPNTREALRRGERRAAVAATLRRRSAMVLEVARANGHRNLLLGAWGCGVFGNDPAEVADAFGAWLEDSRFGGSFDRVVFAVFDRSRARTALNAFQLRYAEPQAPHEKTSTSAQPVSAR
jgi:uncharacterized protein (TIGR02452 family)